MYMHAFELSKGTDLEGKMDIQDLIKITKRIKSFKTPGKSSDSNLLKSGEKMLDGELEGFSNE
jgi:hypothetical protein